MLVFQSTHRAHWRRWLLASASFALSHPAFAASAPVQPGNTQPEQVYVWGLRQDGIGRSMTASEGTVLFATFVDRPLLRPGEVAEVIPGLVVTQHSGSGKANQYFMRGFNLDHGTDFSVSLDGVPLNLRTHAHGQGYLDLNAVTPELLERIEYRKGPYFPDAGDFSAAGAARFETFSQAPSSYAEFWGGEHSYYRVLGVQQVGDSSYIAADLTANDGPWVKPEGLRKANLLGHFGVANWAVTALAYVNDWDSTDQVPLRAIRSGDISRLGYIDPTDGGRTSRFIVSARNRALSGWDTVAYVQKYDLKLWSDFTYFLHDPVNGDQFEQSDDRWVLGGSTAKTWTNLIDGWDITAGGEVRDDIIDNVALYHTKARQRIGTVRSDSVNEYSGALWTQGSRAFGPLRATLGMRLDAIGADVSSDNPLNSGSASDAILSPKATLAWRVSDSLELYGAAGRGFHSNDARGATETVSPQTGLPADKVNLIAPGLGAETGLRWERGGFNAALTAFWLHLDSELIYTGDAGDTESTSASERFGGEVLFGWRPIDRIDIDVSAAATNARYLGNPPGGSRIPNAIEYMFSAGISVLITGDLTATFTLRSLGPAPLIEDASVKSRPATLANLLLRYRIGRFTFGAEILNLFDAHADDIEYFYTSRLPGEPADGVDDYHIHPAEPRTWRLGVRVDL
jgi:hypothetical protein